ncbi:hypothetical protein A7M79_00920 [Acinetobacter baumannii]|uniref:sensor histidine kinase n=1 Tax=Acinetobacter baumannii TaxID=470 RepID=UPI0008DC72F1|nr:ATP-binding protein [Acinetobacter baumannii]OIH12080.1 hypothetical protein A7M79_00920 [Acinetobacter baumannii]
MNKSIFEHYRVGVWYGAYRVLASISIIILWFQQNQEGMERALSFTIAYIVTCVFQLLFFTLSNKKQDTQILIFGFVDIVFFSVLSFYFAEVSIHTASIYVITVFILNLALSRAMSLLMTAFAIICFVYPIVLIQWVTGGITFLNPNSSFYIILLFIFSAIVPRIVNEKYKKLHTINEENKEKANQFREINDKILESIRTGYIVLDMNYNIISINQPAKTILDNGGFKGVLPASVIEKVAEKRNLINRFSFNFSEKDLNIQVSYQVINESTGDILLTIEEMGEIQSKAQTLKLALLGQLSASLAHEIRNPVATISQATHLMNVKLDDPSTDRYIKIIENQCTRICNIVESTLDMSKTGSSKSEILALRQLVDDLILESFYKDRESIIVDIPKSINIIFDKNQFTQVITNLINNALRHNSSFNKILIKTESIDADYIEINVIDSGDGVKSSFVKKMFTPFSTTEKDGTGLGLYISKSLCEVNLGDLIYSRRENKTCFSIKTRII